MRRTLTKELFETIMKIESPSFSTFLNLILDKEKIGQNAPSLVCFAAFAEFLGENFHQFVIKEPFFPHNPEKAI